MLKIELTAEQIKQLEPYFEAVRSGNKNGVTSSIGAQIWMDGMVVRLFHGKQRDALCAALGGSLMKTNSSAYDRLKDSADVSVSGSASDELPGSDVY